MKKLILITLAALTLAACEKQADTDELEGRYVVYTSYDPQTDFSSLGTYYLPDSILIISNSLQPTYSTGTQAQGILQAWADNMETRGFTRSEKREDADLGLQVSYVENTYHFNSIDWGGWGWDYPWYWGPGYWGYWGGWYYPFVVSYSFNTGTFLAELVNLTSPQGEDQSLPVVWNSCMSGALSGSTRLDSMLAIDAVNQAFAQSAYLSNPQ